MFFSKKSYPLKFVIAGFEHSGTTLISEIMRQHPNIDSGFEGGLLLCNSIADFKSFEPFASNFRNAWKISDKQFSDVCNSKKYSDAYKKIRAYSDIIPNKSCDLFDKTPRYMQQLSNVLARVPDVPAVVVVRDMRSIIDSTFRRSNTLLDTWFESTYPITLKHSMSYLDGLTRARENKKLTKRVLVVRYEELILNQDAIVRKIFRHLDYEFDAGFLQFNQVKYRHVYGNDIQDQFIYKYRQSLSDELQNKIKQDFSKYDHYFWD